MTLVELSNILRDSYDKAPVHETATAVHLFGIRYADALNRADFSLKELVSRTGIPDSYRIEIRKGMNLAKYVTINE